VESPEQSEPVAAEVEEDVLDESVEHVPPPAPPGPRTRFRRKRDYAVVVLIVLVVAGVATFWWRSSDAAATVSVTGSGDATVPPKPAKVPAEFTQLWQARSGATTDPVIVGPTIVTGDKHIVTGHDPVTGASRWSYDRGNLDLCTVAAAWGKAVAVYHKTHNCSEVTELDGVTGKRGAQRNGDAELNTQLMGDSTYLSTSGTKIIDTWRSDLVQTQQYGTVTAQVNHDKQPRLNCVYSSELAGPNLLGVIERCPDEQYNRFTLLRPGGTDGDGEKPNVLFSVQVPGDGGRIVALTEQRSAIALPNPSRLVIWNSTGSQVETVPLAGVDLAAVPNSLVQPTVTLTCIQTPDQTGACEPNSWSTTNSVGVRLITWFTGSKTIALSGSTLDPLWTVDGSFGPGTVYADRILVPVPGGLAVVDPANGNHSPDVKVDRKGYQGQVRLATLGDVLVEQRGDTLVAMR
jgi:hypothetical protein